MGSEFFFLQLLKQNKHTIVNTAWNYANKDFQSSKNSILEGTFEIDSYDEASYMYEGIAALRALMMQRTAPTKYKKILSLESHLELRRGG